MQIEILSVNKLNTGLNRWQIPVQLAQQFNLHEGDVVRLSCGALNTQAAVVIGRSKGMGLSQDIINKLKLPAEIKIGIKPESGSYFRLGPVIGIMTFRHCVERRDLKRYVPYALRMKTTGLLYVFDPRGINSGLGTIHGFYYNESRHIWEEGEFPFPDVVMDRIYPTNLNNRREIEAVIGPNRIFNKNTLISKTDFFEALDKDGFLRSHTPETRVLRNENDLAYMISKYPGLYLKPVNGMKGKGIVEVTKNKQGLVCRYLCDQEMMTTQIKRYRDIFSLLEKVNPYNSQYIVQALISRMTIQKQPFDLRVMVTKNGKGEWLVPAIFTKVAAPGQFLTNISAGGKTIFFKDLLNGLAEKLPYSKTSLLNRLTEVSLKTASLLDSSHGPLGKLGLDVVIDLQGKPWVLEANGNPGLMPVAAYEEYPRWRSERYDFPLAYSLYLSGFSFLKAPFIF